VCIPECPEENDPRCKVCTNRNETWGSDCEVHQQRCFCDIKDERCNNGKNSHIHIEYYGECKTLQVKFGKIPMRATFHRKSPFVRYTNDSEG
jgi:secreted protein acidic and rich in cysteine